MIDDILDKNLIWDALQFTKIPLINHKGMKLFVERNEECEIIVSMYLDSNCVMTTKKLEHTSMRNAVLECPNDARVFIGGLGFGLILLYLAESGKAKEVIVVEKDERVLEILAPKIKDYFRRKYPAFKFEIKKGDAYDEILNNGMFDWIYIDITDGGQPEFHSLSSQSLTDNGVYTSFKVY